MFAENRCLQIDSACSNGYQCDQRVLLFGIISSHTNLVKLFLSFSLIFACLISAGLFFFSSRLIVDVKVGNYFSYPTESFDVLSTSTWKSFVLFYIITIIYNCSTIDRVFKVLFHSFNARNVLEWEKSAVLNRLTRADVLGRFPVYINCVRVSATIQRKQQKADLSFLSLGSQVASRFTLECLADTRTNKFNSYFSSGNCFCIAVFTGDLGE